MDPTFAAEVPPHLWLRSGRPFVGTATRVYLSLVLIATALIFVPRGPTYWGLIVGGVVSYFLFPLVVQGLLKPIERRVLAVRRREATALLQEVRARRVVRQFAPHAWLTLQEGRLHLRRGDGKAAARAFAETVRLSRGADEPALVSAQAQALLIAEQPEQARELLQALAKKRPLTASDRLHLGLALLAGKGNGREATEHVQAAAQTLGGHPRVLAALALALHRSDEVGEALVMLQRAQDALGDEPDPFDEALVQRGVKLMRTVQKAQQKRERKVEAPAAVRVAGIAKAPATEAEGKAKAPAKSTAEEKAKSARRVKKDERRAARRAAKAEKRSQPEVVKAKKGKAAKAKPEAKVVAKAGPPVKVEAHPVEVAKPAVQPVAAKVVAAPAVQPVAAKVVAAPVVQPVAAKVVAAPVVQPVAAKVVAAPVVQPVAAKVEAAPVVVQPVVVQPVVARPAVSAPAAGPARPAPPTGTALFGSLGAPGPRVASGPVVGGPGLGLPRVAGSVPVPKAMPVAGSVPVPKAMPVAGQVPVPKAMSGVSGEAVPKAMLGEVTAPAPKAASIAAPVLGSPLVRPVAPVLGSPPVRPVLPSASSTPIVRPVAPVVASTPIVRPAAPAVASAPIQASRVPAAAAASVLPPSPAAVVQPTAPVAPSLGRTSKLAQVLPDTDDGWDDMLNALEGEGPSSPR
ncbi:MAG: hypothetical protein IPO88_32745 [Nannocystis sp.]|nr:hypothetical protein [Nannocystis sp.]